MSSLMLWAWLVLAAAPSPQTDLGVGHGRRSGKGNRSRGRRSGSRRSCASMPTSQNLAQVETDAEGRFTIDAPAGGGDRPRFLLALGPRAGVAGRLRLASNRPKDDRGPIRLTLGPPAKTPVRVRGVDGKPVAGATVRLSSAELPRRPAGQARGHDRCAGARDDRGCRPRAGLPR